MTVTLYSLTDFNSNYIVFIYYCINFFTITYSCNPYSLKIYYKIVQKTTLELYKSILQTPILKEFYFEYKLFIIISAAIMRL